MFQENVFRDYCRWPMIPRYLVTLCLVRPCHVLRDVVEGMRSGMCVTTSEDVSVSSSTDIRIRRSCGTNLTGDARKEMGITCN